MTNPGTQADQDERKRIFRALVPWFGTVQPSAFFQKTQVQVPGVERVHNLIEGIYKPAGSTYPLAVASMLKSPYSDQVFYSEDRTWWIHYSPKVGGMDLAVNAGLIRCMTDRQPLLVMRQVSDKSHANGARHRLLGLGYVESFDPKTELFRIRGLEWAGVCRELGLGLADAEVVPALRLEALEAWTPFVAENRAIYQVSRQKRDAAFKEVVLENYGYTCAVTRQRFRTANYVEAEGAHIIAKEVRGTDDPRNGVALSKSVHWAFDRGMFTISDQYEVVVHPKITRLDYDRFPLFEMNRQKIQLPKDDHFWPHRDALRWHKEEVFDRFSP